MLSLIKQYKQLPAAIINVIIAEFFVQLVNNTFMLILPLYLSKVGYTDEEIALFITVRFLGVFLLALPIGHLIKGKN